MIRGTQVLIDFSQIMLNLIWDKERIGETTPAIGLNALNN